MTFFLFHLLAIGDETLKREGRKGEKHQWTIAEVIRGFYLIAYPSICLFDFVYWSLRGDETLKREEGEEACHQLVC